MQPHNNNSNNNNSNNSSNNSSNNKISTENIEWAIKMKQQHNIPTSELARAVGAINATHLNQYIADHGARYHTSINKMADVQATTVTNVQPAIAAQQTATVAQHNTFVQEMASLIRNSPVSSNPVRSSSTRLHSPHRMSPYPNNSPHHPQSRASPTHLSSPFRPSRAVSQTPTSNNSPHHPHPQASPTHLSSPFRPPHSPAPQTPSSAPSPSLFREPQPKYISEHDKTFPAVVSYIKSHPFSPPTITDEYVHRPLKPNLPWTWAFPENAKVALRASETEIHLLPPAAPDACTFVRLTAPFCIPERNFAPLEKLESTPSSLPPSPRIRRMDPGRFEYFEVIVEKLCGWIAIGLRVGQMAAGGPNFDEDSCFVASDGTIFGGKPNLKCEFKKTTAKLAEWNDETSSTFGPPFYHNEAIGCGWDPETKRVYFVRYITNHKVMCYLDEYEPQQQARFWPTIVLSGPGTVLKVNMHADPMAKSRKGPRRLQGIMEQTDAIETGLAPTSNLESQVGNPRTNVTSEEAAEGASATNEPKTRVLPLTSTSTSTFASSVKSSSSDYANCDDHEPCTASSSGSQPNDTVVSPEPQTTQQPLARDPEHEPNDLSSLPLCDSVACPEFAPPIASSSDQQQPLETPAKGAFNHSKTKQSDVQEWLRELDLGDLWPIFEKEGYTSVKMMAPLNEKALDKLGIMQCGPRNLLLAACKMIKLPQTALKLMY